MPIQLHSSLRSTPWVSSNGRDLQTHSKAQLHRNAPVQVTRRELITTTTSLTVGRSVEQAFADTVPESASSETPQASPQVFLSTPCCAHWVECQVYMDISVDGVPTGRVVIALYSDVKLGSRRFLDLAVGKEGVRYRSSKFTKISDGYIFNGGVKSLTLTNTGDSPIAGGESLQELLKELKEQHHSHDDRGLVSLQLKNPFERPKKKKLVAMKGKLITVEEGGSIAPNGTAFVITTGPVAELDATHLVIGHVVSGLDIIQKIESFPRIKDNSDSIFLKTAKLIGDVRADLAEQNVGKPFNRIIVSSCGRF